ncbi:MAG: HDOD domain-containing protein [Desulfatitalea sp.]|nr:HDOD domain-containing protein [Desulfatitalea sp.]
MDRNEMLKQIQAIDNLPTLPHIALAVNRMLQDEESPMEQLAAMLEKDQSLVLKLLRLVNSSFFGFKSKVKSVRHAVTLLGYNTVQNAVITVSVIDTLSLKNELKGFDIAQFWEHAIHVAVLSKHLAAKTRVAPAEEAFTAGLLHDIGKVVLANFFPDVLIQVLQTVDAKALTFAGAEQTLEMVPHSLVGSHLAQRWMLPESLVATIKWHHSGIQRASQSVLAALVDISDTIAHIMAGENGYHLKLESLDASVKTPLVTFFQADPQWFREVKTEMRQACDFFKQG